MSQPAALLDDRQIVTAMCNRESRGLAAAYDTYANRLYAYSCTILHDRDSAADAVQDAFLIAGQRITELRDPTRLRPWLYAIVRNRCLREVRDTKRLVGAEEADELPDESVDLDAGLRREQQRKLIADAAGGLNSRDREVLELSLRHGLDGAELAAALGVKPNHAHALVSRAREQLERALSVVLVSRMGRQHCIVLDQILDGWDGGLTPLWRKRIGRHIDGCPACGGTKAREVRASSLLGVTPIVALPAAVREGLLHAATDPQLAIHHGQLAADAGRFDGAGFPRSTRLARHAGLATKPLPLVRTTAAAAVIGGLVIALHSPATVPVSPASATLHAAADSAATEPQPAQNGPVVQGRPVMQGRPVVQVRPTAATPLAPTALIPEVRGLTEERARESVRNAGFTVGVVTVAGPSSTTPGRVVGQLPAPRTVAVPGTGVDITLAGRDRPVVDSNPGPECPDGTELIGGQCRDPQPLCRSERTSDRPWPWGFKDEHSRDCWPLTGCDGRWQSVSDNDCLPPCSDAGSTDRHGGDRRNAHCPPPCKSDIHGDSDRHGCQPVCQDSECRPVCPTAARLSPILGCRPVTPPPGCGDHSNGNGDRCTVEPIIPLPVTRPVDPGCPADGDTTGLVRRHCSGSKPTVPVKVKNPSGAQPTCPSGSSTRGDGGDHDNGCSDKQSDNPVVGTPGGTDPGSACDQKRHRAGDGCRPDSRSGSREVDPAQPTVPVCGPGRRPVQGTCRPGFVAPPEAQHPSTQRSDSPKPTTQRPDSPCGSGHSGHADGCGRNADEPAKPMNPPAFDGQQRQPNALTPPTRTPGPTRTTKAAGTTSGTQLTYPGQKLAPHPQATPTTPTTHPRQPATSCPGGRQKKGGICTPAN
jgi:RNA polymerase sigma factor (sigma-70 family)